MSYWYLIFKIKKLNSSFSSTPSFPISINLRNNLLMSLKLTLNGKPPRGPSHLLQPFLSGHHVLPFLLQNVPGISPVRNDVLASEPTQTLPTLEHENHNRRTRHSLPSGPTIFSLFFFMFKRICLQEHPFNLFLTEDITMTAYCP